MGSNEYSYLNGFGSYHESQALPGCLPIGQNSPQVCPYGLYAEQLSGTAFTAVRSRNQKSWLYRIRPSVALSEPYKLSNSRFELNDLVIEPKPLRWDPRPMPCIEKDGQIDFIDGLEITCGAGDPSLKTGLCVYTYTANVSMDYTYYNSDGDYLIVPQQGKIDVYTEMGRLLVEPCEIIVIPRGIKFSIRLVNMEKIRGYVLEVFEGHFELPGLGPIGANGLANPRDFLIPVAWFEDVDNDTSVNYSHLIMCKYLGQLFTVKLDHSPYDVVGWHGNYYPYKYDLRRFNAMGSISFDHPDPSIFTVLTCQSLEPGVAVADFVIFPPRWMVADHTFRPPFFHRNCMSEYMGMIYGNYDAKAQGFVPGGASLHSCMTPHGPDATTFINASSAILDPVYFNGGLAFMFESTYMMKVSRGSIVTCIQENYWECWKGFPKLFKGINKG